MTTKFALLSVSDKADLPILARALVDSGHTLLSTGGTYKVLENAGLPVTKVSDHTGAPEIMNGRVKTLHPMIHGGILGDRERHAAEAQSHGIAFIDVVVCNLYPFEQVTSGDVDVATAVETVDIGGPTMVRAAAKNHAFVTIVTDPKDYTRVASALKEGAVTEDLRRELAVKAFRHTARYDSVIAGWFAAEAGLSPLADETAMGLRKLQDCRYGENPHQTAAFYADADVSGRSLARVHQHQGKAMSFNNIADLDGALRSVFEYDRPACAIIKHMNPCGCATGETLSEAFTEALKGDPVSAFGGIVVFNRPVDGATVRAVRTARTFFEVLAAPGFDALALERLAGREKLRVLELPQDWSESRPPGQDARRVQGGWLLQDWDLGHETEWRVVTQTQPTSEQMAALKFAWAACRNVKSNAIVLARAHQGGAALNGVGAGQMSRVDSVRLAVTKATEAVQGSVLASDAFFPFADGLQVAIDAGVSAVVQPGGSVKDDDVIAAADQAGIAMVFTGCRHFRH